MKKSIAFLTFLLFTTQFLFAMKGNDVIILKNGNSIHGQILEDNIQDHVAIKIEDGSTAVYIYDDIESIRRGDPQQKSLLTMFQQATTRSEADVTSSFTKKLYFRGNRLEIEQEAGEENIRNLINLNGFYSTDSRDLEWNYRQEYDLNFSSSGVSNDSIQNSAVLNWRFLYDVKRFLSNSPFFLQGRLKGNQSDDLTVSSPDPYSSIYVGTGLGRIWDLARWRNTSEVERILLSEGFLKEEFNRVHFARIMEIISTTDDVRIRLENLLNYLDSNGLLATELDAKIALRLQETLQSSVRTLPSGFQVSAGITRELTKPFGDLTTNATFLVEYDKPWGSAWLFSFPFEGNFLISEGTNADFHVLETEPAISYDTDVEKFSAGYNARFDIYAGDSTLTNLFTDKLFINYSHSIIGQLFAGAEISANGRDFLSYGYNDAFELEQTAVHKYGFKVELRIDYYIFN